MLRNAFCLLILATFCATAPAEDARFEIEAYLWGADLEMSARIDDGTVTGTEFSLAGDLGVDTEEDLNSINFRVNMGESRRHHLFFNYSETDFSGSNTLNRDITIEDTTYTLGEAVALEMDYTLGRIYYGYSFVDGPGLQVGLEAGVLILGVDGVFMSSSSGAEDFDITVPMPVLGLHTEFAPGKRHRIRVMATAFLINSGDVDGDMLDWEVRYDFFPVEFFGLGIGTRDFDLDVDIEEEGLLDIGQDGIFYELTFRF